MTQKKYTIGYVADNNPFTNKNAWSGLVYKVREAIENAGFDVVWINCRPNSKIDRLAEEANKLVHGKATMYCHTRSYHYLRAKAVDRKLLDKCDALFFPGGVQMMSYLRCNKPTVFYTDNTFRIMCGYYWGAMSDWQYRMGEKLERQAIANSTVILKASNWAAESVARDYGSDKPVYVLKFGANIDETDLRPITPYSGEGPLNILFSGVDWKRKGADVAIGTVEELRRRGIDARLTIVGLRSLPEQYRDREYINFAGFLNKTNKDEYARYISLMRDIHLFLLPTRAECAGIVFCEASAMGIPTFTYDTGGIPDYVKDGVNGYRLPLAAGAREYADKIESAVKEGKLQSLFDSSRQYYRDSLNWGVWSRQFREVMMPILEAKG